MIGFGLQSGLGFEEALQHGLAVITVRFRGSNNVFFDDVKLGSPDGDDAEESRERKG
ncbi:hypothetical protein DY000_02060277 [Brassica cretica]|uniref:Uncharacterized protein n=1 Tax=Brassica cretica TaxID=69181 RepID=A0ABQ7AQY7_BRACR|nr:hypothetical protein DY000_02060277 [Brassica cretica]